MLERDGFEALLVRLEADSSLQLPAIDGRDFCRRQKPAVQVQCERSQKWAALLYEGLKEYAQQMRAMPLDKFEAAQRRLGLLNDRLWAHPHWGNVLLCDWIVKVQTGRLLHRAVYGAADEVKQLDALRAYVHDHAQEWKVVATALQREHNATLDSKAIENGWPGEEAYVKTWRRQGYKVKASYEAIYQLLLQRKVWNEKQMDAFGIPVAPVLSPVQILQYGFSWQFLILVQGSVPNPDRPCIRKSRLQYIMTFLERLRNEAPYRSNAAAATKQDSNLSALLQKAAPDLVGRPLPDCPKGLSVMLIRTDLLFVDAVDLHDQARPPTPRLDFETAFGYF